MSILDNVRIERSGMKKAENQTISTEIDKTGEIEPQGLATKEEYVITAKIRYSFWCNNAQLEHAARSSDCSNMIVTQGKQGALYNNKMYPAAAIDVIDVCGAGDTFLAALAYEYLQTDGNMEAAVEFAIRASAVTVQHTGVYAPRLDEIK